MILHLPGFHSGHQGNGKPDWKHGHYCYKRICRVFESVSHKSRGQTGIHINISFGELIALWLELR